MAEKKKQHWLLGTHDDRIGDSNIGIQDGKRTRSTTSMVVATAGTGSAVDHRHLPRCHLSISSCGSGSGGDSSCWNTASLSSDTSGSFGFSAECSPARVPAAAAAATGQFPCSPAHGGWVGRQLSGGSGGGSGSGNGNNLSMFKDPRNAAVSTNSFVRQAAAGSAAGAENRRHDSFRPIATASSCCSSGRASKDGAFPCRLSSPLSFGSVCPDPIASAAVGGGDGNDDDKDGVKNHPSPKLSSRAMIRSAAGGSSGPSASPIRSSVPAPSPAELPSNLPTARALRPVFPGPGQERFVGSGDGGGILSSDVGWSSSPSSQSGAPAPAHATSAIDPAWPIPFASSGRPFSSVMPIGRGGGYLHATEMMHCDGSGDAYASDVRKIGSIEEIRSGSPCSVAVNAKSPQRQVSGVSGGRPNASGVKRARSSGAISHTNDEGRYGRGRKGGRRMKHSSDSDPISSATVTDDDRCPALALPSASTKTHERACSFSCFPGERNGGPAATGGHNGDVDASSGNILANGGWRTDVDDVVRVCLSARPPV
ncbi:unnamed protein product [Ectocarpus sp. 8 AP-2014]